MQTPLAGEGASMVVQIKEDNSESSNKPNARVQHCQEQQTTSDGEE
jgi:hypothetical protein